MVGTPPHTARAIQTSRHVTVGRTREGTAMRRTWTTVGRTRPTPASLMADPDMAPPVDPKPRITLYPCPACRRQTVTGQSPTCTPVPWRVGIKYCPICQWPIAQCAGHPPP